jgi:hypothetical protein
VNTLFTPESSTNINVPKFVDPEFVMRNNYYVVSDGKVFNSYSIKVIPDKAEDNLIRIERNPPVLLEGFAIVGRKIYMVSMQDLLRKIIRKSKEIKKEASNGTSNNSTNAPANPTSTTAAISSFLNSNPADALSGVIESGTVDASELEISKAANAAWEEQVGSLFDPSFEVEDSA